jgi:ABC-type glycerol-3-phosphate transport system permease component
MPRSYVCEHGPDSETWILNGPLGGATLLMTRLDSTSFPQRKRGRTISVSQVCVHLALIAGAFVTMFPFYIMLSMAAKDPAQIYAKFWQLPSPIRWENLLFGLQVTMKYFLNSLLVSGAVCVLTIVVAMLAAYAFGVHRFRGRNLLYAAIISLMMVPGILTLIPLFLTVRKLGMLNHYSGLILPQVAGSLVIAIFLLKNFFAEIPKDLFDSARIDGAQEWQVLWHVVLPLSTPILSTVAILNVLGSWNNYVWPLLVVRDEAMRTIPLGLAFLDTEYYLRLRPGMSMATYAMASVPMVLFFLFAMKTFIKGMVSGAIKG